MSLQPYLIILTNCYYKKSLWPGPARVTGVSKKWLQDYVNALYSQVTQQLKVTSKPLVKLTIECDVRAALPQASLVIR